MKNIRLVSNIILEDDATFTLENVRVLSQDIANGKKLDAYSQVDQSYSTVTNLFSALREVTVDIATSTLVD